jgi:hypothetical protein
LLLVILSAVGFAVFHKAGERLPTAPKSNAAVTSAEESKQATQASGKEAASNTKSDVNNREYAGELVNEKKQETNDRERGSNNREAAVATSRPAATKPQQTSNTQQSKRTVGAPALRLPNPDLENNLSVPANETRTRTLGSASSPPQFFRAADGTLTVKFADGSTTVVKPGARSDRPD